MVQSVFGNWRGFGAATAASMLLVACGGTTATGGDDGEPGTDASAPIEVTVTLSEFAIEMSQTEFQTGLDYRFVVTNAGAVPHEMMLVPPMEPGAMNMEEMDQAAVAAFSADDLTPGATVEQIVRFSSPGEAQLEAACYLPGHYEAGMKLPIVVTD